MIAIMLGFVVVILGFIGIFLITFYRITPLRTIRLFNKLPGPTDQPFLFGATFELLKLGLTGFLPWIEKLIKKYNGIATFYTMDGPTAILTKPEYIEVILTSNKNIEKGLEYKSLKPWLSNGLVLSTGEKWKQRRKMLTPSFHFKILENSSECMNRNFRKVCETLLQTNGDPVEPLNVLGRGALNIISETAMGTILDENDNSEEYVAAVKRAATDAIKRVIKPLLRNDFLFSLSSLGRKHLEDVKFLHDFTEKIIRERQLAYKKEMDSIEYIDSERMEPQVFLDSLFRIGEEVYLTDEDIREEVDTFMFAGHDTTSTALHYVLLELGNNPDKQEIAYQEQVDIFGQSERDALKEDLSRMHYLDQVIKETLRLHPPIPHISRLLSEDAHMPDGLVVPRQTKVLINFYYLHRDSEIYPDPEQFKPERFTQEESKSRHPYAYLPFSAGPRNCIGQKFAMMEMKIALSMILRTCLIKAVTRPQDLKYMMLILLVPDEPIKIEVHPRIK